MPRWRRCWPPRPPTWTCFGRLRGPVEELKHHRGITHTFIAVPVVAAAAVGMVWLFDRWLAAAATAKGQGSRPKRKARPRGRRALGLALFDGADLRAEPPAAGLDEQLRSAAVFSLQSALVCGQLCVYRRAGAVGAAVGGAGDALAAGAGGGEIGARQKPFRGRGWAIFALTGWWCCGAGAGRSRRGAGAGGKYADCDGSGEAHGARALSVDPFRWHAILETQEYYQTAEINTRTGEIDSDPQQDVIYKPPGHASRRGRQTHAAGPGLSGDGEPCGAGEVPVKEFRNWPLMRIFRQYSTISLFWKKRDKKSIAAG